MIPPQSNQLMVDPESFGCYLEQLPNLLGYSGNSHMITDNKMAAIQVNQK